MGPSAPRWLPDLDSNQDYLIQSQACYRCTIRQSEAKYIRWRPVGAISGLDVLVVRGAGLLEQHVAEPTGVRNVSEQVMTRRLPGVLDPHRAVAQHASEQTCFGADV